MAKKRTEKVLPNTHPTDIINRASWDKDQWLEFFRDRLYDMKAKREPFETQWGILDNTRTSVSFYDNTWELQVSIPLEKTLIEIYEGRTRWRINYDIKPDGQNNIEELQPSKYALKFFLDGNEKDNFWKENKKMKSLKAHYGNGFFYTWIRNHKEFRQKLKEDEEIQPGTDLLNPWNFDEYEHESWYFFPKSIHPQDFWIDDNALGQPDVQYAQDAIMKERIKMVDLHLRYKWMPSIDQDNLDRTDYWVDPEPKNQQDRSIDHEEVILYHYFNRVTKTYMIVANEEYVLYNGYYFYEDGKLPFVNIQHYYDPNSFYTEGISARVSYLKAYKSEVFQNILTGSAMASGVNLVVGNDDHVWQDWTVWGRQLNLWRTTGWAESVQQVSTSTNLGFFTTVMDLIDRETAIVTGINPSEQVDATSDVLGIVEINEANKAVRTGSVDEAYDIGLDEALTMTLDRIKQFAPHLLSEVVKNEEWKIIKTIFPKIEIQDMKVKKEKGKVVFEEDLWKFWYFELKPWVVQGRWVKVVTASTSSVMPIIERRRIDEYISNIQKLASVAQLDVTGESMQKLKEFMKFEQLVERLNDAYDYDSTSLKANTEKDKKIQENQEKLEQLKQLLAVNPTQNETTINQGQEEPLGQAQGESAVLGATPTAPQIPWGLTT